MYELINWDEDYDISADRLNHMDNGIKTAIDGLEEKIDLTEKGVTIATLVDGKVPQEQLPTNVGEDYLPLSGGTLTGNVFLNILNAETVLKIGGKNTTNEGVVCYFANNRMGIGTMRADTSISTPAIQVSNNGSIILFSNTTLQNNPSVDDNSKQLATTNFVKEQSASMDTALLSILNQCYKKDPSGLIHQFVELEATAEEIDVQFPISFPEKCLFVGVEILNPGKDSAVNEVKFETIEKTLDSVKLLKIGTGTPTISVMAVGI